MFNRLRLRLSALYSLAALAFLVLLGGGCYWLISYYFQDTTDLALKHKMAHEFQLLAAPVPSELVVADLVWSANRERLLPLILANRPNEEFESGNGRIDDDVAQIAVEEAYDGELAAIFMLPLSAEGEALYQPHTRTPLLDPNHEALNAALEQGSDLRTITLESGVRVRLLTYRLIRADGPAALQLGRTLTDQDRILRQLLGGLMAMGGIGAIFVGFGSWWLAGRSMRPAQETWSRQQVFVANASHELRALLTLVRPSAEVALHTAAPDDYDNRELLGDIIGECDHMARLVDEMICCCSHGWTRVA
ncbi:MAG: hypothetical protein MI924_33745 [Chloroflexales bacterium]|nr:hypothetical protein [Chloroflexales bacterium]